ncbi:MAG: NAD-reducing hydrogenase HoxS subunit delta [Syntrophomonadaceae bacterium]|nr:NAD-reducing hydrogenase HoxS subunit delta [Bacillota bacterium]
MSKPKVAIFKFSSCSGCQLVFLNCEEELLDIAEVVDIAYFVEGKRDNKPGPYDIGFVEGAISCPEEVSRIKEIREQCQTLVAIGSCAIHGGLQALKNWKSLEWVKREVYPQPELVSTLEWAQGIDDYVPVDAYLPGCPIDKGQLLEFIKSVLLGRTPNLRRHSVCMECKMKENVCVLVAGDVPCMGPVTVAGCGALCPSYGRGCYGCFGPMDDPNPEFLARIFEKKGLSNEDIVRQFRKITPNAEAFRRGAGIYE